MYYTIETVATGWAVSFGKHWLATFNTHAEARAFIYGRRTLETTMAGHGAKRAAEEAKKTQTAAQTD